MVSYGVPVEIEYRNVRAQLPNLSVYMGHLGMLETYHYLSATPELLTIAGEMFDRYAETGGPL